MPEMVLRVATRQQMFETYYICAFKFLDMTLSVESQEGIAAFCDGFWINSDYEYTTDEDRLYWIPPSRMLYVEKQLRSLL